MPRYIPTDNPRVDVLRHVDPTSPYNGWWYIRAYRAFKPHAFLDTDGKWKEEAKLAGPDRGYYPDQEEAHAHLRRYPYPN